MTLPTINPFCSYSQDTLINGIYRAKKIGFTSEFIFDKQHYRLIDTTGEWLYAPSSCTLVKYERFEGMSDPADSSILFLIRCSDGNQGYISSPYGIYADKQLLRFMSEINR